MWALDLLLSKGLICISVITVLYFNFLFWTWLMGTALSLYSDKTTKTCTVGLMLIWLTALICLLKSLTIIITLAGVIFFGVTPPDVTTPWLLGVM